ncbi:MAG TPA: sigma 54-interacting transcriptional regulator, partial [Spirochaetales bacterium]|nr:sigma 54-interacting transcriptional regulator [Spirochaetales bacterium]
MSNEADFEILALVDEGVGSQIRKAAETVPGCALRVSSGEEALDPENLAAGMNLVLLDPEAVPVNAADSIVLLKAANPGCEIVLLLSDQDITMDVELMKIGAYGALPKPLSADDLRKLIRGLMEKNEVERENRALIEALGESRSQTIVSHSPEMEKVLSMAARAARSDSTVLISGESGTGKELIARAIHLLGPRRSKPFVPVNIAALPENLIESELFGHVKGSFTGAMNDRTGRFALANGGTLFIDEIGEVPPGIQVKLLRVLQFG